MNVYYDGSYMAVGPGGDRFPKNAAFVAWGIVIDGGEGHTEISGARKIKNGQFSGLHEVIAFVEAVLYCSSHGYSPQDVNFITDDEITAYGPRANPKHGYAQTGMWFRLMDHLDSLVRQGMYTQDVIDTVMPYIERSVFHKIRGHKTCVMNQRCDYIAKIAGRVRAFGGARLLSFELWAALGMSVWKDGKNSHFHPPFVTGGEFVTT